jgi:hypothetical protein
MTLRFLERSWLRVVPWLLRRLERRQLVGSECEDMGRDWSGIRQDRH